MLEDNDEVRALYYKKALPIVLHETLSVDDGAGGTSGERWLPLATLNARSGAHVCRSRGETDPAAAGARPLPDGNIPATRQSVSETSPHSAARCSIGRHVCSYGGPSSQQVTDDWLIDIDMYFATSRRYVIAYIDGRGTTGRCAPPHLVP